MCAEDPVDLPTAEGPADPVGTGPKDRQIPQTKHTHVVFRIEIGRPVLVLRTRRVGLVGLRAGPFARQLVNTLAVAVVKVELQATGELPAHLHVECVIVRVDVAGGEERRKESRIRLLQEILIHQTDQLVAGAPLITGRRDQFPRQTVLHVEGVDVDVGVAELGRAAIDLDSLIEGASLVPADTSVLRVNPEAEGGVYRITRRRITAAQRIEDRTARKRRAEIRRSRAAADVEPGKCRWIPARIGEEHIIAAVVRYTETTSHDRGFMESRRTPGEADAGPKIVPVGLDEARSKADFRIHQAGRPKSQIG